MDTKSVKELKELAKKLGIAGFSKLRKDELVKAIKTAEAKAARAAKKAASGKASKKKVPSSKTAGKKQTGKTVAKKVAKKKSGKKATAKPQPESIARAGAEQGEEELIESAKYFTTPAGAGAIHGQYPPDLGEDIESLPALKEPRLTLLSQKPGVLLARWELEHGRSRSGGLLLRLGLLADKQFHVKQEVPVASDAGSHYFHVDPTWPPHAIYLQLGSYNASGEFGIALRRGIVRLPRLFAASSLNVNWALTADEFEYVVKQSGSLGSFVTSGVSGAPSSHVLASSGDMSSSHLVRKP
jgi:hypothetical protein